jgi:hypothetical protein
MSVVSMVKRVSQVENSAHGKSNQERYEDLFNYDAWAGHEWRRLTPREIAILLVEVSYELAEESQMKSKKALQKYHGADLLTKLIRVLTFKKHMQPKIQTRSQILDIMVSQCLRLSKKAHRYPDYDWFQGNPDPFRVKPPIVARLLRPHQHTCP